MSQYNRQKACEETFKCQAQADSVNSSWNNIGLFRYEMPAFETPEHTPLEHAIVVIHNSLKVIRRLGGELKEEQIYPDRNIVINPSGVPQSGKWQESASFSMIFLDPKIVSHVYHESIDPDAVEILPHFSQRDPIVNSCALALEKHLDPTQFNRMYAESAATFLGIHLLTTYGSKKIKLTHGDSLTREDASIVKEYIQANFDKDLSLLLIASLVNMSPGHFGKCFASFFGCSPCKYLRDLRLNKAAKLLIADLAISIDQVAISVGMTTTNFRKQFRLKFRVSPSDYRN
jgi:AraC family transcriptional regulator